MTEGCVAMEKKIFLTRICLGVASRHRAHEAGHLLYMAGMMKQSEATIMTLSFPLRAGQSNYLVR